jgi:hypothetical protein
MPKHVLFLIHGIGMHGENWAEELDGPIGTLKRVSEGYAYFKDTPLESKVEFVPLEYDRIFRAATKEWQKDSNAVKDADPAGAVAKLTSWLNNAGETENNFWWTNVCDLVLYRLSASYRQLVRASVIDAIATKIKSLMDTDLTATCSVLAHSMGTAVTHDCLHLLGTVNWGGAANALGPRQWRFDNIFMVANTSRLLEMPDGECRGAYDSIVRPGPSGDADSYCARYWNIRHEADPVPFPRPFEPQGWQGYTFIPLRHFYSPSIHNLSHYLINPRAHIPILRSIVQQRAVTADEEASALDEAHFPQFAGEFAAVERLKNLKGELESVQAGLGSDPTVLKLAKQLVRFWDLTAEVT